MTRACLLPPTGKPAALAASARACLPSLTTERLVLQPATIDHYPLWQEVFGEAQGDELGGPHTDEDIWYAFAAYVAGWLLYGHGPFTASLKSSGDPLGFILYGLEWDDLEVELGWLFPTRNHGNGYATEGATAIRDFAMDHFGPGNVVSYIPRTNTASARVARRLGAARDTEAEAALARHAPGWRHSTEVWRHGTPLHRTGTQQKDQNNA